MHIRHALIPLAVVTLLSAGVPAVAAAPPGRLRVAPVSNIRADMISGGQVLLRVTAPAGVRPGDVTVRQDAVDITEEFVAQPDGTLLGLVTGLRDGVTRIRARAVRTRDADLRVINHPIAGPVFSGPRQRPYVCQTDQIIDGFPLAPSTPPECAAPTEVRYKYRSTAGVFKDYVPGTTPADLATATVDGRSVPYVVRLEEGTIDRAVYEIAALDDGHAPDPMRPESSWNERLVYAFGFGCNSGYHQGTQTGGVLNDLFLRQGYGVASSTLNTLNNNCNIVLAAEAAMMVKEHFIETYGPVRHTIGWGGSGGSIQQYGIADAYPGIVDGIIPSASYPNANGTILDTVLDCRVLNGFFTAAPDGNGFTAEQMRAVSGFNYYSACTSWVASFAGRLTATGSCDASIPRALLWDPETNPDGVRCAAVEQYRNQLGVDPRTGFTRGYLDNVGVQYGLSALRSGAITPAQFIRLNAGVGGQDVAGDLVPARTAADPRALAAFYAGDLNNTAALGLTQVPIIDLRPYVDPVPGVNIHTAEWSYVTRARLAKAGAAGNQVIIESGPAGGDQVNAYVLASMDRWLDNLANDTTGGPAGARIARARPAGLADGCYLDTPPAFHAEPLAYGDTTGQCPAAYPIAANPRLAAGQPLDLYTLKCALKPVSRADYPGVTFTTAAWRDLRAAFPAGVCDYRRPGPQERAPVGTWLDYGSRP